MPAYVVQLPFNTGYTLPDGANAMVVFATDAAEARSICAGKFDGDSIAAWAAATVTEVLASQDMNDPGWKLLLEIVDATPIISVSITPNDNSRGVVGVAINSGGSGYSASDVLTVAGGTSVRAATIRVTSVNVGVIDGIEIIDPGDYSADPSLTANAVTGGGGSSATMDLTMGTNQYENFVAKAVTKLNLDGQIAGASVDLGAATPLLTVAETTDGLGDKDLVALWTNFNSDLTSVLLGTVTDGGASGAALSVEIPGSNGSVPFGVPVAFKA